MRRALIAGLRHTPSDDAADMAWMVGWMNGWILNARD